MSTCFTETGVDKLVSDIFAIDRFCIHFPTDDSLEFRRVITAMKEFLHASDVDVEWHTVTENDDDHNSKQDLIVKLGLTHYPPYSEGVYVLYSLEDDLVWIRHMLTDIYWMKDRLIVDQTKFYRIRYDHNTQLPGGYFGCKSGVAFGRFLGQGLLPSTVSMDDRQLIANKKDNTIALASTKQVLQFHSTNGLELITYS